MPFAIGNKLALGNQFAANAHKHKAFTSALKTAVNEDIKGTPVLRKIADKLVKCALNGEAWAILEVANRIDGRVPQAVVGDPDAPPVTLQQIVRVLVVNQLPKDINGVSNTDTKTIDHDADPVLTEVQDGVQSVNDINGLGDKAP